jgi:hypothetical protein
MFHFRRAWSDGSSLQGKCRWYSRLQDTGPEEWKILKNKKLRKLQLSWKIEDCFVSF